jgi:hypothetical protein
MRAFTAAGRRRGVLAVLCLGLGLALGACSKCDLPYQPANAPHVCHAVPDPQ